MVAPADSPMMQERDRARRLATGIVSIAMGIVGLTLIVLAIVMVVRGGAGLIILAIVVGLIGFGLAGAAFFFQLVPFKLHELAEEKRAYDRRMRER